MEADKEMKAEYINPFLESTQDVFKQMLGMSIEKKKLELRDDFVAGLDVNILIGVIGDLQGSVIYSFTKKTALEIVKSMAGMDFTEIDPLVASALGEIGNIISGNSITRLAKINYRCDIAPPQIILGGNRSISIASSKYLLLHTTSEAGDMTISVTLKEPGVK